MSDTLEKDLERHFRIKTPCIWIETFEEQKALSLIHRAALMAMDAEAMAKTSNKVKPYEAFEWSIANGGYKINLLNGEKILTGAEAVSDMEVDMDIDSNVVTEIPPSGQGLVSVVKMIQERRDMPTTLFIIKEFVDLVQNTTLQRGIRDLKERLTANSETYTPLIIIAPATMVPFSLQKLFVTLHLPLPDISTIKSYVDSYSRKTETTISSKDRDEIARAACGLSSIEIARAFGMSGLIHGKLDVSTIVNEKIQVIKKSGILSYREPKQTLDTIGGHDVLKQWIRETKMGMTEQARSFGVKAPRGYISVGFPGAGKTAIAEAIADYFGVPLVVLDLSKIMGGIVGESERTARQAFEIIDALGECVVLIDEAEKQLGGINSSNKSDGGTLARVFNVILDHLNENEKQFYVLTSNDISQLPSALTRSGRLDNKWFFDFPTDNDRSSIFQIHLNKIGKSFTDKQLELATSLSTSFTGAEIANAVNNIVRLAYFATIEGNSDGTITDDHITKGIAMVSTVAKTSPAEVTALRTYASKNGIRSTSSPTRSASQKLATAGIRSDDEFLHKLMDTCTPVIRRDVV